MLASSSAGNSTFVRCGQTRLLVDAGISRRELFEKLKLIGEDPREIDAILITHEHTDHVSGLPGIARKIHKPIFLSRLAAPSVDLTGIEVQTEIFQAGLQFYVGDLQVSSFTIPHDSIDPVGFVLQGDGVRIGIVTDLGYIPESVKWYLQG